MVYNIVIIDSIEEIYKITSSKGTTWYNSSGITESEIPLAQVLTAVMYLDLSHLDSLSLNTNIIAKIYQII